MHQKVKFEEVKLDYELPTLEKHVTQELISHFGCGSLDFNPIHMDPVWAKKVNLFGFGKTIGHGQMTIAHMTQVITNWCYTEGGKIKSIDIKLIWPIFPEDSIRYKGKVVAKHPRKKGISFIDLELEAVNQKNKKIAVGKAQVYLP